MTNTPAAHILADLTAATADQELRWRERDYDAQRLAMRSITRLADELAPRLHELSIEHLRLALILAAALTRETQNGERYYGLAIMREFVADTQNVIDVR